MLLNKDPLSIIEYESENEIRRKKLKMKRNEKKLFCITNYHLKRKRKQLVEEVGYIGKRRKKEIMILTDEEEKELRDEITKIDQISDEDLLKELENEQKEEDKNQKLISEKGGFEGGGMKRHFVKDSEYNCPSKIAIHPFEKFEIDCLSENMNFRTNQVDVSEICSNEVISSEIIQGSSRLSVSEIPKIDSLMEIDTDIHNEQTFNNNIENDINSDENQENNDEQKTRSLKKNKNKGVVKKITKHVRKKRH